MNSVRWRVQEAAAKVSVEELAAKPTLAPALGYTRQYQNSIGFPDANSWSASLTMSVPIFDKNQGNIQKACATQRQLQWQYQSLRLSVRAQVEQAAAELDAAFENASTVAEEQLKLAADVQESIGKAYQAGERSLIDVLDAQRNYRETNRLFVTTRAAYWRALYAYYAAIGGQQMQQ
jgi:cobalt-zinc-cadmium efflux system outer membrane protein